MLNQPEKMPESNTLAYFHPMTQKKAPSVLYLDIFLLYFIFSTGQEIEC
jgi:hypothetical protein